MPGFIAATKLSFDFNKPVITSMLCISYIIVTVKKQNKYTDSNLNILIFKPFTSVIYLLLHLFH